MSAAWGASDDDRGCLKGSCLFAHGQAEGSGGGGTCRGKEGKVKKQSWFKVNSQLLNFIDFCFKTHRSLQEVYHQDNHVFPAIPRCMNAPF